MASKPRPVLGTFLAGIALTTTLAACGASTDGNAEAAEAAAAPPTPMSRQTKPARLPEPRKPARLPKTPTPHPPLTLTGSTRPPARTPPPAVGSQ